MAGQEDPVQREIHQDWANREYIEVITSSIKKIADFLNSFGEMEKLRLVVYFTSFITPFIHASMLIESSGSFNCVIGGKYVGKSVVLFLNVV